MAGLYRRGAQRSAGLPLGQAQASQGAGGAIPRGFAPKQEQEESASEKAQKLGGLLGMMNQQRQAQQEVQPALTEADAATQKAMNLPDPASTGFAPAPSAGGEWGGVQAATGAAMNAGKAVSEVQPQSFMDMLQNGWGSFMGMFGGGAGA